jgi:hypothetical protein
MNERDDRKTREVLRQAFPPVDTELQRDLWPDVLRKLDVHPKAIPWYDWALLAVSTVVLLSFPRLVLVLAYHL